MTNKFIYEEKVEVEEEERRRKKKQQKKKKWKKKNLDNSNKSFQLISAMFVSVFVCCEQFSSANCMLVYYLAKDYLAKDYQDAEDYQVT